MFEGVIWVNDWSKDAVGDSNDFFHVLVVHRDQIMKILINTRVINPNVTVFNPSLIDEIR